MLRLGPPLQPGTRVLVRLPSWLGDLVAAEPALRALAERLGDPQGSGLSLAAPRHLLPILDGERDAAALFPAARRLPHEGRGGEQHGAWRGHDVAVLFTNSFRSAWTAWRAGIPRRAGWARDGRGWLLTDAMGAPRERGGLPLGLGRHGTRARLLPRPFGGACAELVGLLGAEVRDEHPRVCGLGQVREPLLLVNAGARPASAKGLPPALLAEALQLAAPLALRPLVVCGPGEEAAARAVVDAAAARGLRVEAQLPDVPDLPRLSRLCGRARVAWTADAGPLHVLRAHRTPRVVLQGPTDPRHSAELLDGEIRLRVEVPCGPCHAERCPLSGADEQRCMRSIEPQRLVDATRALLQANPDCG